MAEPRGGQGLLPDFEHRAGHPLSNRRRRAAEWPGGNLGGSQAGFIGGGQAGYNWQTGSFVLGVETDFDWTDLS